MALPWQEVIIRSCGDAVGASVLLDIHAGNWRIYEYDGVAFLVRHVGDAGWVHVFSGGGNLLRASRLFMLDATRDFRRLAARITVPHMATLAKRFGWRASETLDDGFPVYVFAVRN